MSEKPYREDEERITMRRESCDQCDEEPAWKIIEHFANGSWVGAHYACNTHVGELVGETSVNAEELRLIAQRPLGKMTVEERWRSLSKRERDDAYSELESGYSSLAVRTATEILKRVEQGEMLMKP